ncbi:hypothetical protein ACFPVX_02975 [Cohnella faecalis]|uniref:Uncharacterized protein n=1 Tax=Cohnella faecalis TaxID=2315694 RepID=A0A398CSZ7_9BACL|nr:hypothetical protein [Cohnella faecalis]RIE05280.1 hypothetical protein D3H35_01815 [Cohnella faecalis]
MERQPIEIAFERYRAESPEPAKRAAAALKRLLAGVERSLWPEVAWQFSSLTGDGFPVELAFTSTGEAIRYVVDPSGPEIDSSMRLRRALAVIEELRGTNSSATTERIRPSFAGAGDFYSHAERLLRIQSSGGGLAYGAWIGGRHDSDGDRFKLYAEVPQGSSTEADEWVRSVLGDRPLLLGRPPILRMVGLEPDSGRIEWYFRVERMEPWEISRIMGMLGKSEQGEQLLGLVEEFAERSVATSLPCTRNGFSISTDANGAPSVFSLFCLAKRLAGGDGRIRGKLLNIAARRGWPLKHYEAISAPLADREGTRTKHGILSFVAAPENSVQLHVGLRP